MRNQLRISRRRSMILLARLGAASALASLLLARAAEPGAEAPGVAGGAVQPATTAPALPAAIRDALARSAAAIDPITLRWTSRSRPANEIAELGRAFNEVARNHDRMSNEHRHYRLTFQAGKYRASHQEEPQERLEVTPLHESAFDGAFLYGGTLQPPYDGLVQTHYLKYPLASQAPESDEHRYLSSDVLDAMGIRLPVRLRDMKSRSPVRSEILAMLEQDGARLVAVDDVEVDGRKLVRLRILAADPEQKTRKRLHVFHLDPGLNFAICRREESWQEPDVPLTRTDLGGHEKLADDRNVFVPRRIVAQYYSREPVPAGQVAKPVQTRTTEVTQVSGDAKPEQTFTLTYDTPGTRVYVNDDRGKQSAFVVQEDGTLIDARRWRPGRRTPAQ
jgi:hypothetical protein